MPFRDVRILDLTRLLPFEYGTMLLGDMGADVIKVEEPGKGDYMREIPPIKEHMGWVYLLSNRNKRSITLNLKDPVGAKIFLELVKGSDVVYESFRPGVMERLGLGYEQLRAVNSRIIVLSATGYGQTGPYAQRPGHDINYIAVSGILAKTGRHTGAPVVPGIPIADMTAGLFSAFAIAAALLARNKTGRGQYIDYSMTDAMVTYNILHIGFHFGGLSGLPSTGDSPAYESFETADGHWISFGNIEDKFWANFCHAIGRKDFLPELNAQGSRKQEVMNEIKKIIRQKPLHDWTKVFEKEDVCFAPVNEVSDLMHDPQLKARRMFFQMDHPTEGTIPQVAFPAIFTDTPPTIRRPPPRLGEHTKEILVEIGYTLEEIKNFSENKVI